MNQLPTLPDVLSLEEAAVYLRLSKATVRQLAAAGKIPGRKVNRQWRFLRVVLEEWLRSRDIPDSGTAELQPHIRAAIMLQQAGVFEEDMALALILLGSQERPRQARGQGQRQRRQPASGGSSALSTRPPRRGPAK